MGNKSAPPFVPNPLPPILVVPLVPSSSFTLRGRDEKDDATEVTIPSAEVKAWVKTKDPNQTLIHISGNLSYLSSIPYKVFSRNYLVLMYDQNPNCISSLRLTEAEKNDPHFIECDVASGAFPNEED